MSSREPRIVTWFLRLYPESFRRAHGQELVDFVRDELEREARGPARRLTFWLATAIDLTRGAWRAHRPETPAARRRLDLLTIITDALASLRHAWRTLGKTPLITTVIVATLALGVGLNTAIYSVVDAVLLAPFPYQEPDELYYIGSSWRAAGVERANHSGAELDTFRRESRAFEDVAGVTTIRQNLTDSELPRQVRVGWTSTNFFSLLGVDPILGSGFAEDSPPGTLLLSFELWRDRYGRDPEIVGKPVRLDEHPYTVVGVLPRGFELYLPNFPSRVDVWKTPDDWWQNGNLWDAGGTEFALLDLIGRLAGDATATQAQQEMEEFAAVFREQRIEYDRVGVEYRVSPLADMAVSDVRKTLFVLFGAVGLVLLIACANVMNLMLARSFARSREIALRLALGASRLRVVGSLLAESLLLAGFGGLAGIAVSGLATDALVGLQPGRVPRLDQVSVNLDVLRFALLVSLASVVVFGLVPAIYVARGHSENEVLSLRSTSTRNRGRMRKMLVVGQLSLSLVLLIGAGLLTRSMASLTEVQPGFETDNLLSFSVSLPGVKYERPAGTHRFFEELEQRIAALPGVDGVGMIWPLPLSGRNWSDTYAGGAVLEDDTSYARYRLATSGVFDALRIPMVQGRSFSDGDPGSVVVISAQLAEQAWPGESPLGRTLQANPWGGGHQGFEVIGVVGDVLSSNLKEEPSPTLYFDSRWWSWTDWEVDFVVRGKGGPAAVGTLNDLVEPIRSQLAALDPSVPMARVQTMDEYLDEWLASNRFALSLIGSFALVAGLLAAVGLYGVLSYSVSQRVREIGVRMAIGASRRRILSWVLREAVALLLVGIAIGVAGALFVTQFLSSFLYGVAATDPLTFASMAVVFALVGALAAAIPAYRATRVEPIQVLRAE